MLKESSELLVLFPILVLLSLLLEKRGTYSFRKASQLPLLTFKSFMESIVGHIDLMQPLQIIGNYFQTNITGVSVQFFCFGYVIFLVV